MTIEISKKLLESKTKSVSSKKTPDNSQDHAPSKAFLAALDAVGKMKTIRKQ